MKNEWFVNWFDSPYYHVLYQNHNAEDAQKFIDNLLKHLQIVDFGLPISEINALRSTHLTLRTLDLACGKGRHSRYMASKGLDVIGLDLSESSIDFAQQFETETLHFYQHDMRKSFRINYFDYIFNFFTSFGYFEKEADNLVTLKHIAHGLKADGVFVLDYFNSQWIVDTLKKDYIQTTGGIDFHIKKRIVGGHVIKKIAFHADGQDFKFQEKVRLLTLKDFQQLFNQAGLKIVDLFGDYQLNSFNEKTSKRLIIKGMKYNV